MSSIHRRKSSREENDNVVDLDASHVMSNSNVAVTIPTPSRGRVHSSPKANLPVGPGIPARTKLSPQPLGAGISARRPPSVSLNTPPTFPFSGSFAAAHTRAHSRTRSTSSGPFVSPLPYPLQFSFTPAHVPLLSNCSRRALASFRISHVHHSLTISPGVFDVSISLFW
ncbi:hypothetical protein EDD16DRAFT_1645490 [Pisolithus croceorrhizus]|nr:hypothetical protein EDD16DRAFT_1645490 [Pisolithus croceorrhizus]KAI6108635.1 hypothetical protein EV401DRAFT_1999962 [Pisolithus croceorrhizus]